MPGLSANNWTRVTVSPPPKSRSFCLADASVLVSCPEQAWACRWPAACSELGGDASFTPALEDVGWVVKDGFLGCWGSALV